MQFICFNCQKLLNREDAIISRQDSCDFCSADIKCCLNCKFHDKESYNECLETQADRVLDKERSNYCDFFSIKQSNSVSSNKQNDSLKSLNDLFKKKS